jgi:hypothetical protein
MKAKEVHELINKNIHNLTTKKILISFINDKLIINNKHLPACLSRMKWVNDNISDFNNLINTYINLDSLTLAKKIYLLINNLNDLPLCNICNSTLSYDRIKLIISPFCSSKCMKTKDGYAIRQSLKCKAVNDKYGVDNVMHVKKIKHLHREAVNNIDQDIALSKRKSTNINKYGVDNPMKNINVKLKGINTNLERYGVTNYTKTDQYKSDTRNKTMSSLKYKSNDKEWLYKQYITNKLTVNQIGECDNIDGTCIAWRLDHFNITRRVDSSRSIYEEQIIKYIKEIYNGDIVENSRKLISPKEIDIYIPEHRFAIESNGIYFHSYPFLSTEIATNKHLIKHNLSREQNFNIFNITDIEWVHKNTLVKSMIKQRLKLTNNRYFARKLKIQQIIDRSIINKFLDENHIQGSTTQISVCYGLFNNNELIALQTYINRSNNWELTRFAVKQNCTVTGGFSKLLYHFKKNDLNNLTLTSFLSLDFGSNSTKNVYLSNGFTEEYQLKPDYKYFCVKLFGNELVHKSRLRKSKLKDIFINRGLGSIWNSSFTEFQLVDILNQHKLYIHRIYDVGKIKYSLNKI